MTLLLMLFGLMSFFGLPVREYPDIKPPIVSVQTVYPGAGASVIESDVTTALEDSLSGIQGLRTITSSSREEVSLITLEFELGRDLDGATNDVRDRVSQIRPLLPLGILEPYVEKAAAENTEILWIAVSSDRHSELELTDVADRFIRARLAMIPGVSATYLDGERRYAMRIWLDPDRFAARRLTVQDVEDAVRNQNASIPAGRIESAQMEFGVSLKGILETPKQFESLIVAYRAGYPVRLEDVARVELGVEDTRKLGRFDGKASLGISVSRQSRANTLAVARAVKEQLPVIATGPPNGMQMTLAWDSSTPIERSLHEVYVALGLSLVLVVLVIFCFLGSVRATLVTAVAIPTSIIGTFTVMAVTGCSLNVLTLLGLVLAMGLVVDDAIIVLENIHRRRAAHTGGDRRHERNRLCRHCDDHRAGGGLRPDRLSNRNRGPTVRRIGYRRHVVRAAVRLRGADVDTGHVRAITAPRNRVHTVSISRLISRRCTSTLSPWARMDASCQDGGRRGDRSLSGRPFYCDPSTVGIGPHRRRGMVLRLPHRASGRHPSLYRYLCQGIGILVQDGP